MIKLRNGDRGRALLVRELIGLGRLSVDPKIKTKKLRVEVIR